MQKGRGIKDRNYWRDTLNCFNLKETTGTTLFPPVKILCKEKRLGVFVTFLSLAIICYCVQPVYKFLIPVILS